MVGERPNSSVLRSPGRVRGGVSRPMAVLVVVSLIFGGSAPIAIAKDRPNKPPMVKLRAPASAAAGATITLDGSSTNDPDGTIASWDYSFGDGTNNAGTGRVVAVQHVFTTSGTYTVRLTATDNDGATDSATISVTITGGTVQPSADGTQLPPASQIVDIGGAVWTLAGDLRVLRNGVQAANGYGTAIYVFQQMIYVSGLDSQWWQWTGTGWTVYGATKPGSSTTVPAPTSPTSPTEPTAPTFSTSPSGTQIPPASQIVDTGGAVWTLASDGRVLRNGAWAASGYASTILWFNQVIYVLGTTSLWYSWNGAGWTPYGSTAPGATAPPSTSTGNSVQPGQSIQDVVNAAPDGASILLKAGTHRIPSAIVPKSGQTFVGEAGTVVSGAKQLTNFSRGATYWVASGQVQQGPVNGSIANEMCSSNYPRCGYPEDLFIDNVLLKHVAALSDLAPGRWYFDYAADQIYIADDPTGHVVETSVTPTAFESNASSVTIRGLIIEKFATPTQQAAVKGHGSGWLIESNEIRFNHAIGLRTEAGAIARNNKIHHNGSMGVAGSGNDILVENNEIAFNNTNGYNAYWEAGGTKWVYTNRLVVRGNYSHDNYGPGLWTDINNINTLYENNRVEDNDLSGIFHEISYSAVIRNNTLARNGRVRPSPGWVDGAGILIAGSSDVEVYGNTLTDNFQGIAGLEGHRGSGTYGAWVLQNLNVHDNSVRQTGTAATGTGRSGIIDTAGTSAFSSTTNNRWTHNNYWLPATQPNSFIWMGRDVTEYGWNSYTQDLTGTFYR